MTTYVKAFRIRSVLQVFHLNRSRTKDVPKNPVSQETNMFLIIYSIYRTLVMLDEGAESSFNEGKTMFCLCFF